MWDYTKLVVLGVIAVFAAIATNYAWDLAYQVNALVVMLAAGLTFMWTLRTMGEPKRATPNEYLDGVVRAGVIATTFWGRAWCRNLERYSDYESRLPRGRSYLRQGAVMDLRLSAGQVRAQVMGSELYTLTIHVAPIKPAAWRRIRAIPARPSGANQPQFGHYAQQEA